MSADVARSKRDLRRWVIAGLLVGTVVLAGGLLVVGGGSNDGDDERVRPPDTSTPSTTADPDDPAAVLELMPAGPLDGKDSWRLPVLVVPQSDVDAGQTVTVLGRGFLPGERVGVVMCGSEAATEGVAACSLGNTNSAYAYVTYANADEQGDVQSPLRLRQNIDTPATGAIDCASEPERCLVAIGAVNDYDRSGGSFVNFQGAPAFAETGMLVDPLGPYTPGQVVNVGAAGLIPTRDVELVQCLGDACLLLQRGQVDADGTFIASGAVEPVLTSPDGGPLPCGTSCVLRVQGTGLRSASAAPMPADIPIEFIDEGQAPPTLIESTTSATSTVLPEPTTTEVPDPTTTEVPSASSTSLETLPPTSTEPPIVDSIDPNESPARTLAAASDLIVAGRVTTVDASGDPASITIEPGRVVGGVPPIEPSPVVTDEVIEPLTIVIDIAVDEASSPGVGDQLLLFLVSTGPDASVPSYALTTAAGLLTLEQGIVVGGLEGSSVLDELIGLTVEEVAQRFGG
ncbi:MAG: hypothetical protein ACR2HP_13675 [Ilumatobacteraceae bacterium]